MAVPTPVDQEYNKNKWKVFDDNQIGSLNDLFKLIPFIHLNVEKVLRNFVRHFFIEKPTCPIPYKKFWLVSLTMMSSLSPVPTSDSS